MKKLKLSRNQVTVIDDENYKELNQWKWSAVAPMGKFYAFRIEDGKSIYLHRFLMSCPKDKYVDHINGDSLDNRKKNLRICNNSENNCNKGLTKANTSGSKGVVWCKQTKSWRAQICLNGKNFWLKRHKNKSDAIKAYNKAAKELHKQFAYINA